MAITEEFFKWWREQMVKDFRDALIELHNSTSETRITFPAFGLIECTTHIPNLVAINIGGISVLFSRADIADYRKANADKDSDQ